MSRTIKEEDLIFDVALYMNKYGRITTNETSDWIENCEEYVRVSSPQTVTFVQLPDEDILVLRLHALDKEIEKVRAESTRKIDDLKDQKQRLLAITHEDHS